ncbi:hypothetical protein ASG01_10220 [Chryseobacterium sp. Leaf180]|nr:hypothetical protein ASG01_10220 [Chryseobacterium sp. Leaf180]
MLILYFNQNDDYVLTILIYTLLLGFFIIKNQYETLYFNNSSLIFFIFFYLYGIFVFLVQYVLYTKVDSEVYSSVIIYLAAVFTYLIGTSVLRKEVYTSLETKSSFDKNYSVILAAIVSVLVVYKAAFFINQGLFFNPQSLMKSERNDLIKETSQLEIIVGFLITGGFLFFVYHFQNLKKYLKYFIIFLFVFYSSMQLSAGNRKDFAPVIIGIFWVFANIKKIKFTYLKFVGLLALILAFLYIGTLRSELLGGAKYTPAEKIAITLSSNEFVYPFYTLSFEVERAQKNKNYHFKYGETVFINPIINFIPREIFPEKPKSLGTQFVERYYGKNGMGFAFTPVSEFFINFGYFGPALMYLFIGMGIIILQNIRDQRYNFIFFTLIVDFCRGEVSTFLYQFVIVAVFIFLPTIQKTLSK